AIGFGRTANASTRISPRGWSMAIDLIVAVASGATHSIRLPIENESVGPRSGSDRDKTIVGSAANSRRGPGAGAHPEAEMNRAAMTVAWSRRPGPRVRTPIKTATLLVGLSFRRGNPAG